MARASASNKAAAAKQNAKIELPQVSPGSKANSAQWWTFAPANWWTFAPALTCDQELIDIRPALPLSGDPDEALGLELLEILVGRLTCHADIVSEALLAGKAEVVLPRV
jgi:hypothetical protein